MCRNNCKGLGDKPEVCDVRKGMLSVEPDPIQVGFKFICKNPVLEDGYTLFHVGQEVTIAEFDGILLYLQGHPGRGWHKTSFLRYFESIIAPIRVTVYDADFDQKADKFLNDVHAAPTTRTFESGSVRDNDSDKPLVNHLDPYLRLRFGYLLRAGERKYGKGNWKLGQDNETALESLHRHLAKFELNLNDGVEQDEDHLSAVVFNIMLIMKNEEKAGIPVDHYYGTTK